MAIDNKQMSPLKMGLSYLGDVAHEGRVDLQNAITNLPETFKRVRDVRTGVIDPNQAAQSNQGAVGASANQSGVQDASGTSAVKGINYTPPSSTTQSVTTNPIAATTSPSIDFSNPSLSVKAPAELQNVFQKATESGNYGVSKGPGGTVKYALDANGLPLRQDSAGNITSLGSNITQNIYPGDTKAEREANAVAASKQMISDWKQYKADQAKQADEQAFKNSIANLPPLTKAAMLNKHFAVTAANEANASRLAQTDIASKKLGFDVARQEYTEGRNAALDQWNQRKEGAAQQLTFQKNLLEAKKNGADNLSLINALKASGNFDRAHVGMVLGEDIGKATNLDELAANLQELGIPQSTNSEIQSLYRNDFNNQ